jgi:hypothetical protein
VLGSLALVAQEKPARVSGHVRRADTGEPVAKAIVTLYPQDQATGEQAGERVVSTGADGAFVLADVGLGAVFAVRASTGRGWTGVCAWICGSQSGRCAERGS